MQEHDLFSLQNFINFKYEHKMNSEEKIIHDFVMIWYWLGFVCAYIKLILKRK